MYPPPTFWPPPRPFSPPLSWPLCWAKAQTENSKVTA